MFEDKTIAKFVGEWEDKNLQEAQEKAAHVTEQPTAGPTTAITAEQVERLVRERLVEQMETAYTNGQLLDAMPRTDGDAIRLAGPMINGRIAFVDGKCYEYNGKVFVLDEGESLSNDIAKGIKRAINDSITVAKDRFWRNHENGDTKITAKVFNQRETKMKEFDEAKRTSSIRRALESEYLKPKNIFSSNRYISLRNGVIDSDATRERGELVMINHDPALHIPNRCYIDADYTPGAKPGEALTQYLTYSFQGYEEGVKLFTALGIGLFSTAKKRKFYVDIYGPTDSGKSTVSNMMSRITKLSKTAGKSHFGEGHSNEFAMASLKGYKLIFAHEAEYKVNPVNVKKWSGNDPIETDVKQKERIEYRGEGVLFFINNNPDGIDMDFSVDTSLPNRYVGVYTPHTFTKDGMTPEGFNPNYKFDDTLEDRLEEEDSTTISWMIDLWVEWEKLRIAYLPLTEKQEQLRDRKAGDVDTVQRALNWLEDEAVIKRAEAVKNKRDYLAFDTFTKLYRSFCVARGLVPLDDKSLRASLKSRKVIETFDKARLPGYVEGSEWARIIAEVEGL